MKLNTTQFMNQLAAHSTPFVVLHDSWIQLSPYGDFPHANGLQRVDRKAAEILTANFNSFSGKLGRRFTGAPFYVGHPDAPECEQTDRDQKAYGWVMALESRDDGLYGQVKWSKAGSDLIANAHYKFLSPYWRAALIGAENGQNVVRPESLISVGLTNHPNLPVLPLANHDCGGGLPTAKPENRNGALQAAEPQSLPPYDSHPESGRAHASRVDSLASRQTPEGLKARNSCA